MPRGKNIDVALAEMGFTPVAVKARKTKNTNTITLTRFVPETGAVTFKLGEAAAAQFTESIDVYVSPTTHTLAFRIPGTGRDNTAIVNKGSFKVATLGASLPAEYLGKATYTLTWEEDYATVTLQAQERVVTQTEEYATA